MSQRERRLFLWDIVEAGSEILRFTEGKNFAAYEQDSMLRAAVERKFEIIGEALSQAIRLYPDLRDEIAASQQIIAFRNRLIHGYLALDDNLVWSVIQVYLPPLMYQVKALLPNENAG